MLHLGKMPHLSDGSFLCLATRMEFCIVCAVSPAPRTVPSRAGAQPVLSNELVGGDERAAESQSAGRAGLCRDVAPGSQNWQSRGRAPCLGDFRLWESFSSPLLVSPGSFPVLHPALE